LQADRQDRVSVAAFVDWKTTFVPEAD